MVLTDDEARRMSLYGPCENCYGPRDIRTTRTVLGKFVQLYCPTCTEEVWRDAAVQCVHCKRIRSIAAMVPIRTPGVYICKRGLLCYLIGIKIRFRHPYYWRNKGMT